MTIRRALLFAVPLIVVLAIAGLADFGTRAGSRDVADHLPIDSVAAGVYTRDLVDAVDTWISRIARLTGGRDEAAKAFADLDEKVGMSFRDEVLGAFGPGIGYAVGLPADLTVDGLSQEALIRGVIENSVVVARIDGKEGAIRALEGLMKLAGGRVTVDEDTTSFVIGGGPLGVDDDGIVLHGRFGPNLLTLSGSAERAASAAAGFPRGARLTDGADYLRVVAHVEPNPENLMYFNLPQLKKAIEDASLGGMASQVKPFIEDGWLDVGMISASVRTDGGLRTSRFGPEPLADGLASAWLSGAGGMGMLMALPRLVGELASSPSQQAKRTMASMRSAATAVEEFSIDNNRYPASAGWVPLDTLRPELSPTYIRTLPTDDGWGHTILYWSDGTSYRIVSPGADDEIDREWSGDVEFPGKSIDSDSDIVFADGQFVTWRER